MDYKKNKQIVSEKTSMGFGHTSSTLTFVFLQFYVLFVSLFHDCKQSKPGAWIDSTRKWNKQTRIKIQLCSSATPSRKRENKTDFVNVNKKNRNIAAALFMYWISYHHTSQYQRKCRLQSCHLILTYTPDEIGL
jgi:hypothetical protein